MAVQVIELKPLAAETGSNVGTPKAISTATMGALLVDITAGTTVTDFDLWLEGGWNTDPNNFFPVPCYLVEEPTASTSQVTRRQVVASKSSTTPEKFSGIYPHLPYAYVRVRWTFTGTSITFSAEMTVK